MIVASRNLKKLLSSFSAEDAVLLRDCFLSGSNLSLPVWLCKEQLPSSKIAIKGIALPYCSAQKGFYSIDLSSALCLYPLTEINLISPLVLDYCASPGGKSILSHLILNPSLLTANETIKKRIPRLIANLKGSGLSPFLVTSIPIRRIGQIAAEAVIADVPCSGQSLFPVKRAPLSSFHPAAINKCANRERKILASLAGQVVKGGFLLYSTCTFSIKENENNIKWFLSKFPNFEAVNIPALSFFQSSYSDSLPCYRFWPWHNVGRGGFTALLRCHSSNIRRPYIREVPVFWKNFNTSSCKTPP